MFITGSGSGPLARADSAPSSCRRSTPSRWRWITCIPTSGSVIELGGQDAKIIIYKENQQTGDKRAIASMNDKCASGTGATIDKCMIKVGMARGRRVPAAVGSVEAAPRRRQVRRLRRDRHRQPGEVRHPVERDHVLAGRRDRDAEPLGADARQHAASRGVLLLGGPNTYLPFLQAVLAAAHPGDVGDARLRVAEGRSDRGADLRAEGRRSTTRHTARSMYGLARAGERRRVSRARSAEGVHRQRPQGEARSDGRPAARRPRKPSSRRSAAPTRSRRSSTRRSQPGTDRARGDRPRRRLDLVEGRAAGRGRQPAHQAVPALEGQPDRGHQGAAARRSRRSCTTRARRSRCSASAPPATPPTCSKSRSAPTSTSSRRSRT